MIYECIYIYIYGSKVSSTDSRVQAPFLKRPGMLVSVPPNGYAFFGVLKRLVDDFHCHVLICLCFHPASSLMDFFSTHKGEKTWKVPGSTWGWFEATTHFHEIIGSNAYPSKIRYTSWTWEMGPFQYNINLQLPSHFPLPKLCSRVKKNSTSQEPHVVNPCRETPKRSIQSVSYQMDDEDVFPQSCKVCTDLGFRQKGWKTAPNKYTHLWKTYSPHRKLIPCNLKRYMWDVARSFFSWWSFPCRKLVEVWGIDPYVYFKKTIATQNHKQVFWAIKLVPLVTSTIKCLRETNAKEKSFWHVGSFSLNVFIHCMVIG